MLLEKDFSIIMEKQTFIIFQVSATIVFYFCFIAVLWATHSNQFSFTFLRSAQRKLVTFAKNAIVYLQGNCKEGAPGGAGLIQTPRQL